MKQPLSELHRRGNDVQRKGWTNQFLHDLIDSLWRTERLPHIPNDVNLSLNGVLKASNIGDLKLVQGTKITITYNVNGELVFDVQAPDAPLTENSVQGDGTALSKIKLVNDAASPGVKKYYGTDAAGIKGFHTVISSDVEAFTDLSDVIPEDYVGKKNHVPMVVEAEDKLDLVDTEELLTELAKLTSLADAPNNYVGKGGFYVRVKLDESGIDFYET
jgi:hypothetical protein